MFITFNGLAHYMAEFSGQMLLVMPGYRVSSAQEAAECVNRLIINGDPRMGEANADFESTYGNPFRKPGQSHAEVCEAIKKNNERLSAAAEIIPLPNQACAGMPRASAMAQAIDEEMEAATQERPRTVIVFTGNQRRAFNGDVA